MTKSQGPPYQRIHYITSQGYTNKANHPQTLHQTRQMHLLSNDPERHISKMQCVQQDS